MKNLCISKDRKYRFFVSKALVLLVFAICTQIGSESVRAAKQSDSAIGEGLVFIKPAKRVVQQNPPFNFGATVIGNRTQESYAVRVFPALLTQKLDGTWEPKTSLQDIKLANFILSADKKRFLLQPGEEKLVNVRWNLLPRNTKTAVVGLIFESIKVRRDKPKPGSRYVDTITRIMQVHYLSLPGKYFSSGLFDGQRAYQSGKQELSFVPVVKNMGQKIDSPTDQKFVVRDDSGKVVVQKKWRSKLVLPGARRAFQISIRKKLQAGRYIAQTTMNFGKAKNLSVKTPFELIDINQLPTARIAVEAFAAGGYAGGPARIRAKVRSIGNIPANTRFTIKLFRVNKAIAEKQPATVKHFSIGTLKPRNERPIDIEAGKLEEGRYNAVLSYDDPVIGGEHTLTASLTVEKRPGFTQRLRDSIRANVELYFGGLGLFVIVLLLAMVWILLRRGRSSNVRF